MNLIDSKDPVQAGIKCKFFLKLSTWYGLRGTDHRFAQLVKSSLDPWSAPLHVNMSSYVLGPVALLRGSLVIWLLNTS